MDNRNDIDEKSLQLFEEKWTDKMVGIWREKLEYFHAIDTGKLYSSIKGTLHYGDVTHIEHTFAMHGVFVNNGTGVFFKKGNGGDLPFMDPTYRRIHKLNIPKKVGPKWGGKVAGGKPRKPRPWIYRRYYASCKKLSNVVAEMTAQDFNGLILKALECIFDDKGNMTTSQSRYVR